MCLWVWSCKLTNQRFLMGFDVLVFFTSLSFIRCVVSFSTLMLHFKVIDGFLKLVMQNFCKYVPQILELLKSPLSDQTFYCCTLNYLPNNVSYPKDTIAYSKHELCNVNMTYLSCDLLQPLVLSSESEYTLSGKTQPFIL